MSLVKINEIIAKNMTSERKRSELVIKTPKVVVQQTPLPYRTSRENRYSLTYLGNVRAWEYEGRKHLDYGGGQTFRVGLVRMATPELVQKIEAIDTEIKALQEKRKQVLKDKFLWLHPIPYDEIRRVQKEIYEATQR